jgi:DNA-binding CsgD family transcriptional regulator
MDRLSKVLQIVDALYEPVEPSRFFQCVFDRLPELIPCSFATASFVAADTGEWCGCQSIPIAPEVLNRIKELVPQNPCMDFLKKGGSSRTLAVTDFMSVRQFQNSVFYSDLCKPLGITSHLSAVLHTRGCAAYLSVVRDGTFTEAERSLLDFLQPHLSRAYALARVRTACAPAKEVLRDPLDTVTPREWEILHWIGAGKRDSEISLILGISTRTVEKHVSNVISKLGAATRTAAASLVRRPGRWNLPAAVNDLLACDDPPLGARPRRETIQNS